MYRVIIGFHDLQDECHEYKPGDVYPRKGYAPGPDRIEELSGCRNARKTPLIGGTTPAEIIAQEAVANEKQGRRSRKK